MTNGSRLKALTLLFSALGILSPIANLDSHAGGSSRPPSNPFAAGSGLSVDEWSKATGQLPLNLVVSANVASKLGPCGCSVNPKGGVDRRLNFIESQKSLAGHLLVLDAGNALFASRSLDQSLAKAQRDRAKKIAQAHREMGVAAQNVGFLDLASGIDFLVALQKESGLKFISTNIARDNGSMPFAESLVQELPRVGKVLVVGVSAISSEGVVGVKSLDPVKSIRAQIDKHKPKVTVVLSDLGQFEDLQLMGKVGSPLVVFGSRDLNAMDIPMHASEGVSVQPGIQGQQLALLRVMASGDFSSWKNLSQDSVLSQRWTQLESELRFVQKEPSSDDKKLSLERIKESFAELAKYAKGPAAKSWPYFYELVDMDERYLQKNKLTKLSLEDQ